MNIDRKGEPMNKQYLKRLVKLYQSDNNALADEAIAYKARAEKAEEL